MVYLRCGFQLCVNAERASFFEGLEAIYYICLSCQFFAVLLEIIRQFLTRYFVAIT
jgi:hypothetical protein